MNKLVKKYGNSLVIGFTSEECKILGITVGDLVDVKKVETQGGKLE